MRLERTCTTAVCNRDIISRFERAAVENFSWEIKLHRGACVYTTVDAYIYQYYTTARSDCTDTEVC